MRNIKRVLSLFLVFCVLFSMTTPVFGYTGTYGFWVPVTNSSSLWVSSYGTSNQTQLNNMDSFKGYSSSNGIYGMYNDIIYVKPGNVSLSMSVAKYLGTNSYDTTISNANSWTFTTLAGSSTASKSSYTYGGGMYPGTWYKVNVSNMAVGDLIRISSTNFTGYLYCGSPNDFYTNLKENNVDVGGKTYTLVEPDEKTLDLEVVHNGVTLDSADKGTINWSSSKTAVATVKDGVVSFTGTPGTAVITASYTFKLAGSVTLKTVSKQVTYTYKPNEKPVINKVTNTESGVLVSATDDSGVVVSYGYSDIDDSSTVTNWQSSNTFDSVTVGQKYFFTKDEKDLISNSYSHYAFTDLDIEDVTFIYPSKITYNLNESINLTDSRVVVKLKKW